MFQSLPDCCCEMPLDLSRLENGSEPRSTPRSGLETSLPGRILRLAKVVFGLEFDRFRGEDGTPEMKMTTRLKMCFFVSVLKNQDFSIWVLKSTINIK